MEKKFRLNLQENACILKDSIAELTNPTVKFIAENVIGGKGASELEPWTQAHGNVTFSKSSQEF
ncbi:hypothetical protein [Pedobacter cryoconitis]|uniref:Uncharacterized protein n=1 Tax=Pedobacter cryoconitis TaxID=188932 RepID=A0A327SE91_9SPHI|nr:hypothetical protein [Pedobacter cryoconitis]RAJ27221.1 hypothetical protein LY11_03511 [Pedobacter cryoconitis]